jgi:phosphatidylglycerol:prolipoprotein diacylglycerol transferase
MVGFPGLGIEEFKVQRTLFTVGSWGLYWYGVLIALGFLVAVLYCIKHSKPFLVGEDEIIDMLLFAVPAAIVGARLYYCVWNWGDFKNDLFGIVRITDGGLAIYGGVIFAFLTVFVFSWVRHIHAGALLDISSVGLLIGQAIGRWGNFTNIELYGKETTVAWRMRVYISTNNFSDVHPLFLYESLWNALGFFLISRFITKRKFNGQLALMYIAWYGIGRAFLEGMRDPQFILMLTPTIAVSQLLAVISAVVALLLLGYNLVFKTRDEHALDAWYIKREEWRGVLEVGPDIQESSENDSQETDSDTKEESSDGEADSESSESHEETELEDPQEILEELDAVQEVEEELSEDPEMEVLTKEDNEWV